MDKNRSDDQLAALMNNLGGHDLPSLLEAFKNAHPEKPTCFICYRVKVFGLPMAGHKDNHAGLMTPAQMEKFRAAMGGGPRMGQVRGSIAARDRAPGISQTRALRIGQQPPLEGRGN